MTAVRQQITEQEPVIATDTKPVLFYAKGANQRLVRKHGQVKQNPYTGNFYDDPDNMSVVVEFAPDGRVEVEPGVDIMVDSKGWLADEQELVRRGVPTGYRERDLVSALRAHRGLNVDFYEKGNEPNAPQPTPEAFHGMLTKFTLNVDVDNIRGLLEQEKATHKRPMLVAAGEAALEQVQAALADAERQQADAEASGSK
jgi:hypothetical protein